MCKVQGRSVVIGPVPHTFRKPHPYGVFQAGTQRPTPSLNPYLSEMTCDLSYARVGWMTCFFMDCWGIW